MAILDNHNISPPQRKRRKNRSFFKKKERKKYMTRISQRKKTYSERIALTNITQKEHESEKKKSFE